MNLPQGNQHVKVYVADDYAAVAAGAKPAAGEVSFVNAAGAGLKVAADTTVAVLYGQADGTVFRSDVTESVLTTKDAVAAVLGKATITVPASPAGEHTDYVLKIGLPAYGGTISQQDTVFVYGSHKSIAGTETATVVATALEASLNKALKNLATSVVTVTRTAGVITVEAKSGTYVPNKFSGDQAEFFLELDGTTSVAGVVTAGAVLGSGNYNQVAALEEFSAGYNSDYINRGRDWPANGAPTLNAKVGVSYKAYIFSVRNVIPGAPMTSQSSTVIVFVDATAVTT